MGYDYLLDQYSTETLLAEIERRKKANEQGECDYCGRPLGKGNSCKFPDRHNLS